MSNKYSFYKSNAINEVVLNENFDFFYYKPTLFRMKLHKGLYKHSNVLYLFWYIFTFGSYKVLYIKDKSTSEIAHFSNIMPKLFKYNFMSSSDLQIVHCFTYEKYRGNRLYAFALSQILRDFTETDIWIGSHVSNQSSIKVIEKSGFKKMFNVKKKTIFGIYYKINE